MTHRTTKDWKIFTPAELKEMDRIGYKIDTLSMDEKKAILADARERCSSIDVRRHDWLADKPDEHVRMTYDEILAALSDKSEFDVIRQDDRHYGYFGEIGFRNIESKNSSLIVKMHLSSKSLDIIIDKYGLTNKMAWKHRA